MKRLATLIFAALLFAAPAAAADWTVPGDFATIQDALDNPGVVDGDRIFVRPGTRFGAVVTKAVEIIGTKKTIINDGPFLPGTNWARVGFFFPDDYSGNGATIRGFTFIGTPMTARVDDGYLDFGVFSRGANDVTVEHNVIQNTLQAITNWSGSGWRISHNKIEGLWVLNGGGLGIFIGSRYGTPADNNIVSFNKVQANITHDTGNYSVAGICLMCDARYSFPGGPVRYNTIIHNTFRVICRWTDGTPLGVGLELTDLLLDEGEDATIVGNRIGFNDFRKSSIEIALNPPDVGG